MKTAFFVDRTFISGPRSQFICEGNVDKNGGNVGNVDKNGWDTDTKKG